MKIIGITLSPEQHSAVNFIDEVLVGYQGTLRNQSEIEIVCVLKEIIIEAKVSLPLDEVSLQDIMALVLNKMVPRYRVVSARSEGRNLVTYYKIQKKFKLSPEIKISIKEHLLDAIEKVKIIPHNK